MLRNAASWSVWGWKFGLAKAPGPLGEESETGPTAGAEEPELPVVVDEPTADAGEDASEV
jgi:hypothetical protein